MNEQLEKDIRAEIERVKELKLDIGEINNHLSILEGMCRVDAESMKRKINDAYSDGYKAGYNKGYTDKENNDEVCKELASDIHDKAYQQGLDDAWEAARKIGHNSQTGLKEVGFEFAQNSTYYNPSWYVVMHYAVSEVIEKLKAYEEKQKSDEIKVGDEVTHKSDSVVWKAVCIQIDGDRQHMNLMGHTGAVGCHYPVDDFKKTGRHFDIEKILEEIRR